MNIIAIYHHPQECGSPYLLLINQKTGMVVDRITIPEGYYFSGCERTETLRKAFSFTETTCCSQKPTVDNYRVKASYGVGRRYKYRVTRVDITGEDSTGIHTWDATVHIDAFIPKDQWRYSRDLDTFRQGMEEQGFDMTGWCLYRRMKTDFREFLRTVASTWKPDNHLVNLIEVG